MTAAPGPVLVMGAGAVGCFLGGALQSAGAAVHLVGRPAVLQGLRAHGLMLTDLDGRRRTLRASELHLHESPPCRLAPALVLLCVKSAATADAAALLAAALPAGALVVSMQNGIGNAAAAQSAAPQLALCPGIVAFNVAAVAPGHYHRGTSGALAAQDHPALRPWLPAFAAAGLPLTLHADLRPRQWGKLLINLNNPVNALSGLPLRAQLLDRDYRRIVAALQDEALAVLSAAGIRPARVGPLPPRWQPTVLRLPTPLFQRLAARALRIDAQARSSMADDLARGRPTEADALCGEVLRLATAHGLQAPLNARLLALMATPPRQPMSAVALRDALTGG